jgi:hypothetical protein
MRFTGKTVVNVTARSELHAMPSTIDLPNDEAAILARAVDLANWPLTAEAATAFLSLKLADQDIVRMDQLAARARAG